MNRYAPMPPAQPDPFMMLAAELRALRQDFRAIAQRPSGGDNPFGYQPRAASIYEHGVGHSGPQRVIGPGDKVQLMNVALKEIVPQGYYGMATIHVSVSPGELLAGELDDPNGMLLGHVHWQSGDSGGDEDIDLTRGAIIPVGGTTAIVLEAEFVPVDDSPLTVYRKAIVETTVCWETSSDKDPPMSSPAVILNEDDAFTGPWIEIPRQARSMLALGTPGAAYATLTAQFAISNLGTPTIRYEAPDPFRNGAPIRGGANFVRFTNTTTMLVFPTWELW